VFNYFPSKGDIVSALVAENAIMFGKPDSRANARRTPLLARLSSIFVDQCEGDVANS
jgi:hypothetical protein